MGFDLYWASVGLAVFMSIFALDIMGVFSRKNYFELEGKVGHSRLERRDVCMLIF